MNDTVHTVDDIKDPESSSHFYFRELASEKIRVSLVFLSHFSAAKTILDLASLAATGCLQPSCGLTLVLCSDGNDDLVSSTVLDTLSTNHCLTPFSIDLFSVKFQELQNAVRETHRYRPTSCKMAGSWRPHERSRSGGLKLQLQSNDCELMDILQSMYSVATQQQDNHKNKSRCTIS